MNRAPFLQGLHLKELNSANVPQLILLSIGQLLQVTIKLSCKCRKPAHTEACKVLSPQQHTNIRASDSTTSAFSVTGATSAAGPSSAFTSATGASTAASVTFS